MKLKYFNQLLLGGLLLLVDASLNAYTWKITNSSGGPVTVSLYNLLDVTIANLTVGFGFNDNKIEIGVGGQCISKIIVQDSNVYNASQTAGNWNYGAGNQNSQYNQQLLRSATAQFDIPWKKNQCWGHTVIIDREARGGGFRAMMMGKYLPKVELEY